jgi:ribosomal protein S15P/S13E
MSRNNNNNNNNNLIIYKEDSDSCSDDFIFSEIPQNIYTKKVTSSQQTANDISLNCLCKNILNCNNHQKNKCDKINNNNNLNKIKSHKKRILRVIKGLLNNIDEIDNICYYNEYPTELFDHFVDFSSKCISFIKETSNIKKNKILPLNTGSDETNKSILMRDIKLVKSNNTDITVLDLFKNKVS